MQEIEHVDNSKEYVVLRLCSPELLFIFEFNRVLFTFVSLSKILYKILKNFADSQTSLNDRSRSFPIKRMNREIAVFPVVYSKLFFEIFK